jgi:hypothetical protein
MTLTMNNNPIALASICGSLVLTGCATVAPPSAPAPTAPAAAAATATAPTPAPSAAASTPTGAPSAAARPPTLPGALLPFAEVTRGAVRSEGWLPVWTRDDKTWIEIPAALLDKPFFFGSSISGGLGERGFFPGLTGAEKVLALRRSGNTVQLVARNLHARAPEGTPLARAVAESYSESLYGSAPLAAAPHAASKALLVDAQLLFGGDLLGMQTRLEMSYRLPYALDRAHSSIERARALPTGLHLTVRQHYAMPRLPLPPVAVPGAPPPNPAALPNPPGNVPDPRSLFIGLTYTFAPLPAQRREGVGQADENARGGFARGLLHHQLPELRRRQAGRPPHPPDRTLAAGEEGSGRRGLRPEGADPRRARPQRSAEVARPAARGRARMEQGLRARRFQQRTGGRTAARGCRLDDDRGQPGVGRALVCAGRARLGGHRPEPERPAHRRDPARRRAH